MIKKTLLIALSLTLVFSLGFLTESSYATEDFETMEITFAHNAIADARHHNHGPALAFKEYVEERTNGKILVDISPGGALGDTDALQEQTMEGSIEISSSHTEGTIAMIFPKIQALSTPFAFESVEHALAVYDSEYGQNLFEEFREETGVRIIGHWDNGGMRDLTNRVREVRTPEDMQGLSIRTMEIPAHMELIDSLGASATPIGWGELYTSLQTGVVDGQENAVPVTIAGSLYEVQDYYTTTNHVYTQLHLFANDEWLNSLPEEFQEIILEAGKRAQDEGRRITRIQRETGFDYLEDHLEITHLTDEERELFREASMPVRNWLRNEIGDEAMDEFIDAVNEQAEYWGY